MKRKIKQRTADMLRQSTIWFESAIKNHRENHFFLRPDV